MGPSKRSVEVYILQVRFFVLRYFYKGLIVRFSTSSLERLDLVYKCVGLVLLVALVFGWVLFADFFPILFGAYADQRILLSLLLVASTTCALVKLSSVGALRPSLFQLWPFSVLLFSFGFGAFQYQSSDFFLVEPIFYALYFLAFGLCGYLVWVTGCALKVAFVVTFVAAVMCFFYAAMTVTVYAFAIFDGFSKLDEIIPWGFVSIRYWSHVATWLIPIFPLFVLVGPFKRSSLWRAVSAFTATIWWWMLFMSASRGSIGGLCVSLILVLALFGKIGMSWGAVFVKYALYGLLAWLLLSVLIPSLAFQDLHIREIRGDSSGRMALWQEAWEMSIQNFPLGMGPQSWLTHDVLTDAYRSSRKFGHPHNMYLMWAAEYGWISILGIALLCGAALISLFHRVSRIKESISRDACYLVAFTGSVIASLIHAGASAVYLAPGSMLIGLIVLSVYWSLIKSDTKNEIGSSDLRPQKKSQKLGYGVVIIFVGVSLFWFNEVLNYRRAMSSDFGSYQQHGSFGQLPRFWLHGYFPRPPASMPITENRIQ